MIIVGIIIAIILYAIDEAIMYLAEILKPISEYYYKKQRNQL